MLNKNLKLALYGGLIVAAAYSCKPKTEATPTTVAPAEAGTTLASADASYKSDLANYKDVTTVTTQSLSSLSSINGFEGGLNLSSNISSIAKVESKEEMDEMLSQISFQLGAIGLIGSKPDANGRKIPTKFADAKGIWVVTYTGSKYYKTADWVKTGESDFIVLKFPSRYSYSDTSAANNATYTIKKLETYDGSYQYCNKGVAATSTFSGTGAIEAELEVNGVKKMTYSYTSTYDQTTKGRNSASGTMTIDKYTYAYTYGVNGTSFNYTFKWSKDGGVFYENTSNYEYKTAYSESPQTTLNCAPTTVTSTPIKYNYSFYRESNLKSSLERKVRGNVTLETSYDEANNNKYFDEAVSKYSIKDEKNIDSATFNKVTKDTVLNDKYKSSMLYRTTDRAKLGTVVQRMEKVTQTINTYSYTYDRNFYYIVYSDGSKEKLSKKFTAFEDINYNY